MKTLVIRKGDRLVIRAIAFSSPDEKRDRCEVLAFFQESAKKWPGEFAKLSALLSDAAENGPPPDEKKI